MTRRWKKHLCVDEVGEKNAIDKPGHSTWCEDRIAAQIAGLKGGRGQRWTTFIHNHLGQLLADDPTRGARFLRAILLAAANSLVPRASLA
jgi:hypothetical protein